MIAANRSRIRYRDHRLGTGWRHERGVDFGHSAGLIDRVVDYAGFFKKHRSGWMLRGAAIAVNFREYAGIHHDHYRSRMHVPSHSSSRLENQLSLQHIARSEHVQSDFVSGAVALRQGIDLQWTHLGMCIASAEHAQCNRQNQRGCAKSPQSAPPGERVHGCGPGPLKFRQVRPQTIARLRLGLLSPS